MYKHTNILSLMSDFCDKELKKFCKTRFASHFLLIQSIIDAEEGLRHTVASSTWRNLQYSNNRDGRKVIEIIQNDEFWKEAKEIVVFFELLRLVDGDGSTAGYLYEAVERIRTT
ncbi:hypothetical protein GIB67_016324 [Kingdonia uniflora]|uniref:Uncharacterized protein n=1 Tax=Kingdonia uniflora TaxID=39325 RepID=A0A7J7M9I7_9MAGN|nr:hypothetical protein GIB67_016324 [Kingdonia uniflora]